jgi:ABC-type sugar transport system permease subunit
VLSDSAMFNNRYQRFILAAVVPVFIVYVIFMIFPIARSLYYSLFDWSGFTTNMEYIGLGNYAEMASDKLFARSVLNSLKYVARYYQPGANTPPVLQMLLPPELV